MAVALAVTLLAESSSRPIYAPMTRVRRLLSKTRKLLASIAISTSQQGLRLAVLPLLAVLSLAATPPAQAGAVLFIYPTLVMFEGNQRSAEITLMNRGDQTGTFETSWSDMTMTPEGGLVKLEGQAPWSVRSYVRYSPRRVTLAPLESQIIKIALRSGQEVPEGEYYSHFRVLTLNSEDPLADQADAADPSSGVAINARAAIAIPVIWRNSRTTPSASIESVRIDHDANELSVDVRRYGPLSVRGFLHVFQTAPDGTRSPLAEPVPLVIYPSIVSRLTAITLNDDVTAGSLPRGTEVYYSPDLEITNRSVVFASYPVVP